MNRMVTIITPNTSSNCIGRAWVLSELLKEDYNVQIIGMSENMKMWTPLESENDRIKVFERRRFWRSAIDLLRAIQGNVVVACKPTLASFGLALIKKASDGTKVILDIDDWEWGAARQKLREFPGSVRYIARSILMPAGNDALFNVALFNSMTNLADDKLVSGTTLKNMYGGTVVWHARDSDIYNPARYNRVAKRRKYGLPAEKKIVMFFGTYRKHKGIEDLIEAVRILNRDDTLLVLVGVGSGVVDDLSGEPRETENRIQAMEMQPFSKVPEIISMADVVVIPQRRNLTSQGQVPAKVFDAMAMGKAIVGTRVTDMPEILEGCGKLVEPGDPRGIANAIGEFLDNEEERVLLGEKARRKFIENYSYEVMKEVMIRVIARHAG